jgi:hypothetical protein
MTTMPYDRPQEHSPYHRQGPDDDPGEPGDLRALVASVFTTRLSRPPARDRTPPACPPLLRTET